MAGTRTVYRGSRGRFAGASAGKPETVRSGGFANAAFRARVASSPRASKQAARPKGRGMATSRPRLTQSQAARKGRALGVAALKGVATNAAANVVTGGRLPVTSAVVAATVASNSYKKATRANSRPGIPAGRKVGR
jgi:hypothetical protein